MKLSQRVEDTFAGRRPEGIPGAHRAPLQFAYRKLLGVVCEAQVRQGAAVIREAQVRQGAA